MRAARQLVGPIIAMTITLAAVYAPLGIQGGLTGSLFPAESTEMSDINHSGLHAAEPLPDNKSNECRA